MVIYFLTIYWATNVTLTLTIIHTPLTFVVLYIYDTFKCKYIYI